MTLACCADEELEPPELRGGVLCLAGLSEVVLRGGGGVLYLASCAAMAGMMLTQVSSKSEVSDLTTRVKAFTSASRQARQTRRGAGADTSHKTASRLTSTLGHSTYLNSRTRPQSASWNPCHLFTFCKGGCPHGLSPRIVMAQAQFAKSRVTCGYGYFSIFEPNRRKPKMKFQRWRPLILI